jgi:hypothetical protein
MDPLESAARKSVVQALEGTTEYRQDMINRAYTTYMGRLPVPAESNFWLPQLAAPSAGPGTASPDEALIAGVLGSYQYFYNQVDSNGLHTNKQWVTSLYGALHLTVDPAGVNATTNSLLINYAQARLNAANTLVNGTEYRTNFITNAYNTFFGRPPSTGPTGELQFWLNQFAATPSVTQEQMIASLMGNIAYFNRAPSILGTPTVPPTNTTFLNAAYKQLMPWYSPPASEFNGYLTALNNNSQTRQQVAFALMTSALNGNPYRFDPVNGYVNQAYLKYLGRNATAAELTMWKNNYAAGQRNEQLIAFLVDSSEYFLLPHVYP